MKIELTDREASYLRGLISTEMNGNLLAIARDGVFGDGSVVLPNVPLQARDTLAALDSILGKLRQPYEPGEAAHGDDD